MRRGGGGRGEGGRRPNPFKGKKEYWKRKETEAVAPREKQKGERRGETKNEIEQRK